MTKEMVAMDHREISRTDPATGVEVTIVIDMPGTGFARVQAEQIARDLVDLAYGDARSTLKSSES